MLGDNTGTIWGLPTYSSFLPSGFARRMKNSKPPSSPVFLDSKGQQPVAVSQSHEGEAAKCIADNASRIAKRIRQWVGTNPELTKIICARVVQSSPTIAKKHPEAAVDSIVKRAIEKARVEGARTDAPLAAHLNRIEQVIMQSDRKDSALILYIQVLQRGKAAINDVPTSSLLESSGLVTAEDGYLTVANTLYKKAFDLKKVEEMLPGITKPVKVISLAETHNGDTSANALSRYTKWALLACGVAVVVASVSSYIRESGGRAMATADQASREEQALVERSFADLSPASATNNSGVEFEASAADRALFDSGEEHAINSRWVLMMRDFCNIPEISMYYSPAKKQVEQLSKLYPEDIQLARDIVRAEKGAICEI